MKVKFCRLVQKEKKISCFKIEATQSLEPNSVLSFHDMIIFMNDFMYWILIAYILYDYNFLRPFVADFEFLMQLMAVLFQLYYQVLNFGMIVSSALMIWKGLMVVTGSESPIVVVLR